MQKSLKICSNLRSRCLSQIFDGANETTRLKMTLFMPKQNFSRH